MVGLLNEVVTVKLGYKRKLITAKRGALIGGICVDDKSQALLIATNMLNAPISRTTYKFSSKMLTCFGNRGLDGHWLLPK